MAAVLPMTHGYVRLLPIRAVAITISVLIHALFFIGYGGSISAPSSESPSTSVTRLSFLAPAPVPDVVPDRPQEKPEPKKVPPKVEKVVKPVRKVVEAVPEKIEPVPVAQPIQQAASAHAESTPQINKGLIARETERYLSSVMAHIEKHKWYPRAARRYGLEGEVSVRFMLLSDGSATAVLVENGPPMLIMAAQQAVERAVPLPKPPVTVHCPLECEFMMRFSLSGPD